MSSPFGLEVCVKYVLLSLEASYAGEGVQVSTALFIYRSLDVPNRQQMIRERTLHFRLLSK